MRHTRHVTHVTLRDVCDRFFIFNLFEKYTCNIIKLGVNNFFGKV